MPKFHKNNAKNKRLTTVREDMRKLRMKSRAI